MRNQYYRLGLLEAVGDDYLGPREPLYSLLIAAGAIDLADAYLEGWQAGQNLLYDAAA